MKEKELALLAASWQLDLKEGFSEEDVIAMLAKRVEILLSRDMESFFHAMYRLDIAEKKLTNALLAANPAYAIARLIWERQWEKAVSRSIHLPPDSPDDDLKW